MNEEMNQKNAGFPKYFQEKSLNLNSGQMRNNELMDTNQLSPRCRHLYKLATRGNFDQFGTSFSSTLKQIYKHVGR